MALNEKEKNFLKMNSDIDSLRIVYREASLLSAKNNYNNITSIDLKDNNSQQSNDLDLFKLQKEAFFNQKPVIIARTETEWIEVVDHGFARIVATDPKKMFEAFEFFNQKKLDYNMTLYGNDVGEKIYQEILSLINN